MKHRKKRICVAKIVSVHGVKGAVKIKSFTEETASFNKYGDLFDQDDNVIKVTTISVSGDVVIAHIDQLIPNLRFNKTRHEAQSLLNARRAILRDVLLKNEFGIRHLIILRTNYRIRTCFEHWD